MKKIWLLAAAAALTVSLTACGTGNLSANGASSAPSQAPSSSPASSQASSAASIDAASVSDNLAGLQKYLAADASVTGTAETMRADLIGAKSGVRYKYGYNGKDNVTLELYEYDTAGLNDTAKKVLESVKSTGGFTLLDNKVSAMLSKSGKYLMIYTDTSSDSNNLAYAKKVKELFTGFKAS